MSWRLWYKILRLFSLKLHLPNHLGMIYSYLTNLQIIWKIRRVIATAIFLHNPLPRTKGGRESKKEEEIRCREFNYLYIIVWLA